MCSRWSREFGDVCNVTDGTVPLAPCVVSGHPQSEQELKVRLFDSLEEKFNTKRSPNQPNQSQNQSVIDQGNLRTRKVCFVVKGETSRSHEIDEKGFHEKLCASDGSGKPEITLSVIEACNLSENTRVEQTHDGSGQPDECNSSSAHTVKEQHAPDEHCEIASFNTNNEFNRAINEEDIDFNVPGVPHSTVKQLHGASVRDLIQKIENHPNRHALQRDFQQSQSFNPFIHESKEIIHEVGNVECVNYLIWNPKHSAKYVYHTGTWASSIARADTSCATERRRTENLSSTP